MSDKAITLEQWEAVIHAFGEAVPQFPHDPDAGRQKDKDAKLKYTGYVLLLQYEDAGMPGIVYTANPTEWHNSDPSKNRFQASRNLDVINGVVGRKANLLQQFLEHFGEARPLLSALAFLGKLSPLLKELLPNLVAAVTSSGGSLLQQLLTKKRSIPGAAARKQIEADLKS